MKPLIILNFRARALALVGLLALSGTDGFAQSFSISAVALTNGTMEIRVPSRADSYYLLNESDSLSGAGSNIDALLGAGGEIVFAQTLEHAGAAFYQVEQLPLSATNDILNDGISDAFKLQHGLPVFGPSEAAAIPQGYTINWLEVYEAQTNLAALPVASFPVLSTNIVAGQSGLVIPVSFSKPWKTGGRLTYQAGGTAVANTGGLGDYLPPPGYVQVNSGAAGANITIALTSPPAVQAPRTLLLALSVPSSNAGYAIASNTSVATVRIVPASAGAYIGTLSITNGLRLDPQSVKMAIRLGNGGAQMAFFDVTPSPLLSNTFSVPVSVGAGGFQLGGGGYTNLVGGAPSGGGLTLSIRFGATFMTNGAFTTPVSMSISGLTASGVAYSGLGYMTLSQWQ